MEFDIGSLITAIIIAALSLPITFYIKEWLQKKSDRKNMREKLERLSGKNAQIVYTLGGELDIGPQLFTITEIMSDGVTIENELHKVFVPMEQFINNEIILPVKNYETVKEKMQLKEFEKSWDLLFPKLIEKAKQTMVNEMGTEGTEINAVIGIQVKKAIQEAGYEIRQVNETDN